LGLSAGLGFESKIFVKEDAPELLREKLMSPRWEPESITVSGVTDCYQPAERRFEITRKCLHVLYEFRNPVALITKNQLITRDIDILTQLAEEQLVVAFISVTTLDAELARVLEPRTSMPQARLKAIKTLADAGIPVGVMVAPIIPGLTDHEVPAILKAAAEAGASSAGMTIVRLPHSVSDLFTQWLETHRPDAKAKVLGQIRDVRGGKLNDASFGSRMSGQGQHAEKIHQMFQIFSEKYGLAERSHELRTDKFRRPGDQLKLF
jgi:DNA repair photolyase